MFVYIRQFCFQNALSGHMYLLLITNAVGSASWFNNAGEKYSYILIHVKNASCCMVLTAECIKGVTFVSSMQVLQEQTLNT